MRLFIALDIDDAIRERIARFLEGVSGFAPGRALGKAGIAARDSEVHRRATRSRGRRDQTGAGHNLASPAEIHFRGYGFFPTAKSPRVFWIGLEAGPQLAALAAAIDEKMASLGIPKENRAFSPHLTLARGRGGSGSPRRHKDGPNRTFQLLQDKLDRPLHAGVWYHDGPRVLFVPKPAITERIEVHKVSGI